MKYGQNPISESRAREIRNGSIMTTIEKRDYDDYIRRRGEACSANGRMGAAFRLARKAARLAQYRKENA